MTAGWTVVKPMFGGLTPKSVMFVTIVPAEALTVAVIVSTAVELAPKSPTVQLPVEPPSAEARSLARH